MQRRASLANPALLPRRVNAPVGERGPASRACSRRRRAFTLVELLVVIVILAAGAVFVLPAVSNIVSSSKYSSAINTVSASLGAARSRAIERNAATALVFLFDIETERFTLQIVELESPDGQLARVDRDADVTQRDIYARSFRPASGIPPVTLPSGMGVYGLSFSMSPSTLVARGPDGEPIPEEPLLGPLIDESTASWYAFERIPDPDLDEGVEEVPWIFPRNDALLYIDDSVESKAELWRLGSGNPNAIAAVRHAQSFMVVFDKFGRVVNSDTSGLLPTPHGYLELPDTPVEVGEDPLDPETEVEDGSNLFDPEAGLGTDIEPNPEVVLRSAQQLAIVDLADLRRSVGGVLARTPPWLVRPEVDSRGSEAPVGRMTEDDALVQSISLWIDQNAEVLSFNTYTGAVLRRAAP